MASHVLSVPAFLERLGQCIQLDLPNVSLMKKNVFLFVIFSLIGLVFHWTGKKQSVLYS
jgi:hypothetical protein